MTESNSNEYSFDGSWEGERERLGCIESWLDADSIAALVSVGVDAALIDRVVDAMRDPEKEFLTMENWIATGRRSA